LAILSPNHDLEAELLERRHRGAGCIGYAIFRHTHDLSEMINPGTL
jgi:hypothetical protein